MFDYTQEQEMEDERWAAVSGNWGRFHSADYPDADPCPAGCGQTRAYCENQAELCTYVDEDADDHAQDRADLDEALAAGIPLMVAAPAPQKVLVETLGDYQDCPRCGQIAQWVFKHYSDNSVTSYDMCICGA